VHGCNLEIAAKCQIKKKIKSDYFPSTSAVSPFEDTAVDFDNIQGDAKSLDCKATCELTFTDTIPTFVDYFIRSNIFLLQ
jgi:hypothetical protein